MLPRESFLVCSLEQFHADREGTFRRICDFLGVSAVRGMAPLGEGELRAILGAKHNENGVKGEDDAAAVAELKAFYAPRDELLFEALGERLW